MNVGSACTGVGGLDLGLEQAGMRVLWQCEADEKCRTILARHWPGVPCFPDLTRLALRDEPEAGDTGDARGAGPEQPGGRLHASPVPVDLFPGLISNRQGRDFAIVLAMLAELGFHDLAWRVLDSRYFGVPQRRQRVFILARRSCGRSCAEVLLEPESGDGNHQAGGKAGTGVAEGAAVSTLQARKGRTGDTSAEAVAGGQLVPSDDGSVHGTIRSNPRNNSNGLTDARALVASPPYPDRARAPSGLPGRLDDPVRPLTCPFDPAPDGHREAQMGNAVTVPVARWIGRRILDYERGGVSA